MTFEEWWETEMSSGYDAKWIKFVAEETWNAAITQERKGCAMIAGKYAGENEKLSRVSRGSYRIQRLAAASMANTIDAAIREAE